MKTFFTSDMHLGHANICCYCKRPFVEEGDLLEPYASGKPKWTSPGHALAVAERMNERLIGNWNSRVNPEDVVYHLGDFCTKGKAYDVPSVNTKAQGYEELLNGKVIHILGNHDKNNGVKGQCLESGILSIAHYTVMLVHIPPQHPDEVPDFVDFVLCGHVHEQWKFTLLEDKTPLINVGTDVRRYMPVSTQEVLREYVKIMKGAR